MKLPDAELWRAAAKQEMDSLEDLQVYKVVPRSTVPPGTRVYKSRWMFKVRADNTHKARLVVRRWGQVPGKDCGNTDAPVCRLQSVRMVLAIAAEMGWEVAQLDAKHAFLYADIEEEVFVEAAPGFERTVKDGAQILMKLGKSLYRLAQSPRNWWTIDPLLITLGFVPLKFDTCIYIYGNNGIVIILTLYVEDLVGADIQVIESFKRKLMERFKMTDMGDVSLVLGMRVPCDRQNKTLAIARRTTPSLFWVMMFGMANCKPTSTPGCGPEVSTRLPEDILLNEGDAAVPSHYGLGDVPRSNHKVRHHVQ